MSLVVDLYTSVLTGAGIGQDLAYLNFVTLEVCSGNIATLVKKSMCWKLIIVTPDQKTAVCDHCKADLVYNKRSTTKLLRDLRLRHPFEFAAYEEKQLRPVL